MKLPNVERAVVPHAKVVSYLLNLDHREGQGKAIFFLACGFSPDVWEILAAALLRHATDHDVTKTEDTSFGTRYVVEGVCLTPSGRIVDIRSVWFIDHNDDLPRFVTAYPLGRASNDPRA